MKSKPLKIRKRRIPFLPFFMRSSTNGALKVRSGNDKENSFVVATATPYPATS